MTTIQRLINQLNSITQLTKQVEQEYQTQRVVRWKWPDEINEAKQQLLDTYYRLGKLEKETEVSVTREQESGEALITLVDNLNDVLTVLGSKGGNLQFLQAANKENLQGLIGFIIQFSEVFQQVLEEMDADDFARIEDVIDLARRNRDEAIDG